VKRSRPLSDEEAALWARVVATVEPMPGRPAPSKNDAVPVPPKMARAAQKAVARPRAAPVEPPRHALPQPPAGHDLSRQGLDSGWDRRLARGTAQPDFTLDLHGCTLDAAHGRLLHGLMQAKAMGARVVLLVTGKPRPADAADRGQKRGAIRAKVVDWLAHSEHAHDIAAIRNAHRRHGGQGALYVILKRRRN
jgi:DNA-nicking Smr family endonuclease